MPDYTPQGEGGIADSYSFFTGPVPEQQILPGVEYMVKKYGKKIYVLAADYGFGQISAQWVKASAGLIGADANDSRFATALELTWQYLSGAASVGLLDREPGEQERLIGAWRRLITPTLEDARDAGPGRSDRAAMTSPAS